MKTYSEQNSPKTKEQKNNSIGELIDLVLEKDSPDRNIIQQLHRIISEIGGDLRFPAKYLTNSDIVRILKIWLNLQSY